MENLKKKYTIKIPKNIVVLYCDKKKIITVIGPLAKKSIKLKVKIEILNQQKLIKVSSTPFTKISNSQKKSIFSIQGTTTAIIKQLILETSYVLYKKLNLIGVGYRAFDVDNFENKLLFLKLGYSHPIYFKIPSESSIFCLKKTKLFIYGNSYQNITETASFIRSYKKPEPYKGKGILYDTEKIILKEGKKV
jgi:large subunit ribosomal protein L6